MFKFILTSALSLTIFSTASAEDLGFRYHQDPHTLKGVCKDSNGTIGFNPDFIGQCGMLDGRVFIQTDIPHDSLGLNNLDLSGASLRNTTLKELNLRGVKFSGANFSGAKLSDSDLSYTLFFTTNFVGTELRRTKFSGAYFSNNDLSNADFLEADLKGSVFREVT